MSQHIAHVYDGIYIGSLEAAINIKTLSERNIKYVFNLSQVYIKNHDEYDKNDIKIINIMGVPDEMMPNYNLRKLYFLL